jgi:hypothetical protein
MEALDRELGAVGMVRFLQRFWKGSGDFTEERRAWVGKGTVAELARKMRAGRSEQTGCDGAAMTGADQAKDRSGEKEPLVGPCDSSASQRVIGATATTQGEPSIEAPAAGAGGVASTPEDDCRLGCEALARELGMVGFIRFVQLFDGGKGNYTDERREWLDRVDLDAIVEGILKRRQEAQEGPSAEVVEEPSRANRG